MTHLGEAPSTASTRPWSVWQAMFSVGLLLFISNAVCAEAQITIDSGLVSGAVTSAGIRVFKGIPFAAPPVGANRWRTPQPVQPWSGVRTSVAFGSACPQSDILERRYGIKLPSMSEDCLYLDVYAPPAEPNRTFPVMVWIHGGGFSTGHSSSYNGENLAGLGVVVVTINYRVGVFGFLPHRLLTAESNQRSSGNYGLLDMVAALQWVQRNIERFSGDAHNVTLFGQSSGGTAICTLMTAPPARGLFRRAIVQSGGAYDVLPDLPTAETSGERLFRTMNLHESPDPLGAMRAKSWKEVFEAAQSAGLRYSVILDGWCVPEQPIQVFLSKRQASVPLLIGSNANESDEEFTTAARFFAREHSKLNAHTYRYFFSKGSDQRKPSAQGAIHAAEIDYVFNMPGRRVGSPFDALDRDLARSMSGMWVQFAQTGDPNPPGGSHVWPLYNADTDPYLEFGTVVTTGMGLRPTICDDVEKKTNQELIKHLNAGSHTTDIEP